jgi:transcription-repair coupling factor (superfamily II helicase)
MNFDLSAILQNNNKILLKDFAGGRFAHFLVQTFHTTKKTQCLIVDDALHADKLTDEICFFYPHARIDKLPIYDVPLYSGLSPLRKAVLKSQSIYYKLLAGQLDFLIVPKKALLRRTIHKSIFAELNITITKNDLIDREELVQKLIFMGYERYAVVEEPGHFAVRGDIIDIFSPQYNTPHRINFFDIEIEDIKAFNPINQRTADAIGEIVLIPAHEIFLHHYNNPKQKQENTECPSWIDANWKSNLKKRADTKNIQKPKRDQIEDFIKNRIYFHGIEFFLPLFYNQTGSLFDYLKPQTIVIQATTEPLDSFAKQQIHDLNTRRNESDHIDTIIKAEELLLDDKDLNNHLNNFTGFFFDNTSTEQMPIISGESQSNLILKSRISSQISKIHSLAPLVSEINDKRLSGMNCFIVCSNNIQQERVNDLLSRFDLPRRLVDKTVQADVIKQLLVGNLSERLVTLLIGELHEGFFSETLKQWWITDEEIFGKKTKRAHRKPLPTKVFNSFSELHVGDYMIHLDHGVGLYQGLVKLDVDPNQNDFVLLEYLGGDKLYVPVDKLNRLQKFAAQDEAVPQLDKLGAKTWLKTKTKAKRAAKRLAKELLEIQAKRETRVGYSFTPHLESMEEFSTTFGFDETPDQLSTISAVEEDMEKTQPMDRLVCGDVGYGKTEVAIRAAFKAILNNKQVALLVPTTVLAFQHYHTFVERFKNYPINVSLLSRFRSPADQKKTIERMAKGQVDIIVGTHRLLSKDIKFQDLGLLIVDEEHRFGVTHKEKVKKLKNMVDVLTLTATPIPRTLNFSLTGIRDLSIINTPPADRLATRTYTCYFDEITIRDAMMKEIRRGGQVFFVHNRVQSIDKIAKQISKLIPEAKVRFAHGQMQEGDLEEIMISFMEHKFDILVCTTIIESGLDIPNANTMLINRADTFGLAQLYQLRGRVGRSDRQAYCYLIVPHENLQTNKAKRRLAVIQRFTELGSGFKVASHDLEIRGAGNILGDEQSGHIAAIGYDLYIHLLQEAVNELKNKHIPEDFEPELSLNIPAKIPDNYIPDKQLRLILYKEISSCQDLEEIQEIQDEWLDRFGNIPDELTNLINLIRIKILSKNILVSQIKQSGNFLFFSFHPEHQIETSVFTQAVQKDPKQFTISRDGRFGVKRTFKSHTELTSYIMRFLEKLS